MIPFISSNKIEKFINYKDLLSKNNKISEVLIKMAENDSMDDYFGEGDAKDIAEHMAMQAKVITPLANKFREIETLEKKLAGLREETGLSSSIIKSNDAKTYSWAPYLDYKTGVNELGKTGEKPFNFKKNWEARLSNKELFNTYQDSATAIIYDGGSKFKVDIDCQDLEGISMDFEDSFMTVKDYKKHKGIEFDKNEVIYNRDLTESEFLSHKVYEEMLGKDLMKKIAHEIYDVQNRDTALGLYLRDNAKVGELRSLVLNSGNYNSGAYGRDNLSSNARFVRESPK